MIELDLRGYECPMPVVKTLKAIDKNPGADFLILVEKESTCDDITRFCKRRGYAVKVEGTKGDYRLTLKPVK